MGSKFQIRTVPRATAAGWCLSWNCRMELRSPDVVIVPFVGEEGQLWRLFRCPV